MSTQINSSLALPDDGSSADHSMWHPPRPDAESRFYSVTVGWHPGVYLGTQNWASQIHNVPGGAVRSFDSEKEAVEAYHQALAQKLVVQVKKRGARRQLTLDEVPLIPGLEVSNPDANGKWYAVTVGTEPGLYPIMHNITPLMSNVSGSKCKRWGSYELAKNVFLEELENGLVIKDTTFLFRETMLTLVCMHPGKESTETTKKSAGIGDDGLTKHQRYYRRNAERLKRENAARQKKILGRDNHHIEEVGSQDQAVQTVVEPVPHLRDILLHLQSIRSIYTKTALLHLYEDLDKLGDGPSLQHLLELRQRVSSWSSRQGGYLMWNETTALQVRTADRKDHSALEDILGELLIRKVAGQELLCELQNVGVDDLPHCQYDTLVAVRSRMHLISVVSLGLGITEVWLLVIQRELREGSAAADEEMVVDQLWPASFNETD